MTWWTGGKVGSNHQELWRLAQGICGWHIMDYCLIVAEFESAVVGD